MDGTNDLAERRPRHDAQRGPTTSAEVHRTRQRRRTAGFVRTVSGKLWTVYAFLAVLAVWWVASEIVQDPVLIPTPDEVLQKAVDLATASNGALSLWPNLAVSVARVLAGWGGGLVVGVLLGAVLATRRWLRSLVEPVMLSARSVPPLAFAPLLIVWLGIGEGSKAVLLFFAAVPVYVVTTASAMMGVDESYLRVASSLGARPVFIFWRVRLPAALPEILSAMRVTIGITWSTLVAAELVAADRGLGWMILQAGRYLDTSTIFVGIVVIAACAYIMDRIVRLLQARLVPWKGKR